MMGAVSDHARQQYPEIRLIAISGGYRAVTPQLTLNMARALGAVDFCPAEPAACLGWIW
ncbi:MAG: hypothetical protein H7836_03510 [Magnetococcus sp. YQC-3]